MPPHNEDKIIEEVIKKLSSGEIKARSSAEVTTAALEKKQESFWNAQILKTLGIVYGIATPWFIWATVSIFSLSGEVALVKQKQDAITEINIELKEIRKEINAIKVDIAYLKRNP